MSNQHDDHRRPGSATSPGPSPSSSGPAMSPVSISGNNPQLVEENSRTRRGLDRLSGGLRDLGFEVLSRKQRHERDKSNGSNRSSGPKSPDFHKASPPYSRTPTAEGDPRSPDSLNPPGSATSSVTSDLVRRPAQNGLRAQPVSKKPTFVLVTQDHEQLSRVDLTGVQSPAAIRERLYTKARVPDDDFRHCTVHLSSLDQAEPGTPLDDSELWQISQGVLSGEITPAPLFFIQLAVAGTSFSTHGDPSPDYPSSPYANHPPISAHSEGYQDRNPRPDSLVETSSNSSVSRPRLSVQRRASPQDQQQQPPSPMRNPQSYHPVPPPPPQPRRSSYNSPPLEEQLPHPAFFDTDRRSSGGSLHPPSEYRDQQPTWDRRSSAGESDHSSRPEFLDRPGHVRRSDRQALSEAHMQSSWDNQQQQPQFKQGQAATQYGSAGNTQANMQVVGMGPSGPIYRHNNQVMRPRANSASAQEALRNGPVRQQPVRNAPPLGFGPSGPLHFPQPIHHGQAPPLPARQPPPPTIVEHPQGLMPGIPSGSGTRGLNIAKSMDNLRMQGSSSQPPRPPSQDPRYAADAQYSGLYEDPRRPMQGQSSQPMRSGSSDMGRPMSQAMPSRIPSQQQNSQNQQNQLSPGMQSHLRSPPANVSPRVPSYPPYVQRPPPGPAQQMAPLGAFQNRLPPSGGPQLRNYPQQPQGDRRQNNEQMHRGPGMPTSLQVAPGPQRLPLHPGETLQDALHQRKPPLPPRMQKTSPQAGPSSQQPQQRQHPRAASYEDRPQSLYTYSNDPHSRQHQTRQFAEEAPFTASPPAQYSEQQLNFYSQYSAPPQDAYQSPHMQPSRSYEGNNASNRSSSSSAEHHRSPVSSRPSTSSGGPFSDRAAERPPSFSSNSTNEVPTLVSERGHQGVPGSLKSSVADTTKPPSLGTSVPQIVDKENVNDGVALLRESIDAATSDSPEQHRLQEAVAASPSPHYLQPMEKEEQSETMKAREWANLFVNLGDRTTGEDEDTLGKKAKRKSTGASDEEGSTLGKAKSSTTIAPSPAERQTAEPPKITVPAPAIPYNPEEDDDDEAMTWAVQMQPTKPVEPKEDTAAVQTAKTAETVKEEPPRSIALPAPGFGLGQQESPMPSPRLEKPSLRVQTNVNGQQAPSKPAAKAGILDSPDLSSKRSASPRSANRRPRRLGKEAQGEDRGSARPAENSDSALAGAASSSVMRRASFNDNAWAYRPPVEQVYDNLEEFFPGHDLDKPIVDAGGLGGPNSAIPSPAIDSALSSPALPKADAIHKDVEPLLRNKPDRESATDKEPSRRFNQNRKSIRMVAQDRKSRMKKEEIVAKATLPGAKDEAKDKLARRKSTKVWGRKIEEVTSAEADLLYSAKEPLSADKERDELAPIKWVKGELIGKGTYGHVYIGFNVTNGEMIAVKQVELPRTASDKDDNRQTSVVEALKSEMELLKDLEHEKIVSYLGFEESPSHLSILLEYVPGGSVGRCLRKHGKFQEQVIQFFTVQMLEGLEYLHSRGILHRDLKADNILVKMDGTVKISDFGISKKSNDIYNNNSNMSMQGSIFWMAPEVVHNQKKGYSAKIDIWSLGCVVLEMFAGRRPWDADEAIQAMFKLGAERLAPPIPKDVVLSSQASHFLKECFHADPDKRPMASRLLCHKFLTLDKSWDFHMSALYKAMTA